MFRFLTVVLAPLALSTSMALAQAPTDRLTPTIPETQIEPAPLSSPYEFLSVATSAAEFIIQSAALAASKAGHQDISSMASRLSAAQEATKSALAAAGKQDGVEVAKPAMDGEQTGLLGKLEPLEGAEFDVAYVDAQLFAHQRTIAYYRGYADRPDSLGKAAKSLLPQLVAEYRDLIALAEASAANQPPAQ
jgi:predicted outer membrane protein